MPNSLTRADCEPRPYDSTWPLVFSFAVLIASLLAVVVTIVGIDVPTWFTNVWLWIPLLALTTAALLVATERSSQMLRRRMRHALVISLLAHLILAIFLKDQFLAFVAAPKELDEPVAIEPLPRLPQYYLRPPEQTSDAEVFEQPVQASVPQTVPTLSRLEPDVDINIDRTPTPRPLPNTTPVPAPLPFERPDLAAPRRADESSQLSRQEAPSAELESATAQRARFAQRERQRMASPRAARNEVARADNQRDVQRRRSGSSSRTPSRTPAKTPQRIARDESPARQTSKQALAKRTPDTRRSFENSRPEPVTQATPARGERKSMSLSARSDALARSQARDAPRRRRQAGSSLSFRTNSRVGQSDHESAREFTRATTNGSGAGTGEAAQVATRGRARGNRDLAQAQLPGGARAEALPNGGRAGSDAPSSSGEASSSGLAELVPRGDEGQLQRSRFTMPVRNRAARGPGGLGPRPTPAVGVASRRANPQSELVHNVPSRFLRRRSVAPATLGSRSRATAEPFARRGTRRTQQASDDPRRPSAATDAAIELGLQYLASVQRPDGRWSLQHTCTDPEKADRPASIVADSAATGLSLLAFLGAGYDHFGDQYQQQVAAGLNFLVQHQADDGDLYLKQRSSGSNGVWFYSHGIAAIALCEAYGMTGDEALKRPAQTAIDFIVASQSPQRGGWRYQPRVSSDLSVSGWQIMALKSGQLAGLEVPAEVLQKARRLLDDTRSDSRGATFVYNPWAARSVESRNDRSPSTVMTAVGLLMRLYSGWTREHPAIRDGAELLRQRLAESSQPYVFAGLENPNRDTYYWYNATQVMFHMQGEHWKAWNERLYPMLAETQVTKGALSGSWHPTKPVPDRWGVYAGRVYVTALNLLSLEVYYRHLPLFDEGLAVQ